MSDLSRRNFIQLSFAGLGTLLLPKFVWSQPPSAQVDHFFLKIFLKQGADCSYMFDARPLEMTKAGKIQNYLGEEPVVFTGKNGTSCWRTSLVDPLMAFSDQFSILNGVLMSTTFDGHNQNTNAFFTGNPFGGESYIPHFNQADTGQTSTLIDGILNGFLPADVTNVGRVVPIASQSVGPLAEQLKGLAPLDGNSELGRHVRNRFEANSVGGGLFSRGSKEMFSTFDQIAPLREKLKDLTSPDPSLDAETQFVTFVGTLFRKGIARSAIWVLPNSNAFDTHAYSQAVAQPALFRTELAKIARVLKALREMPFDDKRSLSDVTTYLIGSEFGRSMRQPGLRITETGTNHNPLSNSLIIGGKGIRPGLVIGQSDFRSSNETLSKAHIQLDPRAEKYLGKPFDFATMKPKSNLPETFVETDYLGIGSVVNTLYQMFSVPKSKWRTIGREKYDAPVLSGLLS